MHPIETHELTRRFGRTEAVNGLTLSVPEGSVFALLGANGAGKTTTLKMLVDLVRPTRGTSHLLGVDSRRLGEREKAKIGYVSENQELPLSMTVRQLLDFCRPFYPTWDRDLERQLLRQFALPEDRKLNHLSRGMLMKAALLSSLAYRPKLLIMDEPFSGLDPLVRDELVAGLLEVSAGNAWTVLISSHDIQEVERFADHVGMLERGRLQFSEPTEQLQARFRRIEVEMGDGGESTGPLPASWLHLERAGVFARFVDSDYEPVRTEDACRGRFPQATVVAHPMSLREIFVALARLERDRAEEAAR